MGVGPSCFGLMLRRWLLPRCSFFTFDMIRFLGTRFFFFAAAAAAAVAVTKKKDKAKKKRRDGNDTTSLFLFFFFLWPSLLLFIRVLRYDFDDGFMKKAVSDGESAFYLLLLWI